MIRSHTRTWKKQRESMETEIDRTHLSRRYRRRMQASGMLILIGLLITLGQFIDGKQNPSLFTFYWLGILLLTFWLILLALGDALSIAAYSRVAQGQLDQQRRQLEIELQRLKAQQGNGHARTAEADED